MSTNSISWEPSDPGGRQQLGSTERGGEQGEQRRVCACAYYFQIRNRANRGAVGASAEVGAGRSTW